MALWRKARLPYLASALASCDRDDFAPSLGRRRT